MKQSYGQWREDILAEHPGVTIREIKQFGGFVGAHAWAETKHVGSWPDYLIPGYELLEPIKEEDA
ncbi:hypothetical protein HJB79_31465 [Rhizobium lentis]|uniref:hypothetical protein n=1 Tax=Rhizobium lentis TaxID=1138194 RepID=UPI001C83D6FE|nr:hypothetical protein [Rhizobium lentis]MBX5143229.1 hypothetical protein [Rhizobium lentis]